MGTDPPPPRPQDLDSEMEVLEGGAEQGAASAGVTPSQTIMDVNPPPPDLDSETEVLDTGGNSMDADAAMDTGLPIPRPPAFPVSSCLDSEMEALESGTDKMDTDIATAEAGPPLPSLRPLGFQSSPCLDHEMEELEAGADKMDVGPPIPRPPDCQVSPCLDSGMEVSETGADRMDAQDAAADARPPAPRSPTYRVSSSLNIEMPVEAGTAEDMDLPNQGRMSSLLWQSTAEDKDMPNTPLTAEVLGIHVTVYRDEAEQLEHFRLSLLPYHDYFLQSICQLHKHTFIGIEGISAINAKNAMQIGESRLSECRERIAGLQHWSSVSRLLHSPKSSTSDIDAIRSWAVTLSISYSNLKNELQLLCNEISFDRAHKRYFLVEKRLIRSLNRKRSGTSQKDASELDQFDEPLPTDLEPSPPTSQKEGHGLQLARRFMEEAGNAVNQLLATGEPRYTCWVQVLRYARDRLDGILIQLVPMSHSEGSPSYHDDDMASDGAGDGGKGAKRRFDGDDGESEVQYSSEEASDGDNDESEVERTLGDYEVDDGLDLNPDEDEPLVDMSDNADTNAATRPKRNKRPSKKRKLKDSGQVRLRKRRRGVSQEPAGTATRSIVDAYNQMLSTYEVCMIHNNRF
jgi:hypothetical protein